MGAAIPVAATDVVKMLNLPSDMSGNPLWNEYRQLILNKVQRYVSEEAYTAAIGEISNTDPIYYALRYGYAFFALSETADFLNLKTVGQGIVKSVGLDGSSTELLSGYEIEEMKRKMEMRGLEAMRLYLNDAGVLRLDDLTPRPARRLKAGVI